MKHSIEDGRYCIELETEGFIPAFEKQSFYKDARQLLDKEKDIPAVMFSGGLDSQIVVKSLMANNAEFECFFMYRPGANETELENARLCQKRWGFRLNIIDIDPVADFQNYQQLMPSADITGYSYCLYHSFTKQIPDTFSLIQGTAPYLILWRGKTELEVIFSYYDSIEQNRRVIDHTAGKPRHIHFPYTDKLHCMMMANQYVNHLRNCFDYYAFQYNDMLDKYSIWDNCFKPLIHSHIWGDELIYFPKKHGMENMYWATHSIPPGRKIFMKHIDYENLFKTTTGTQKFYEAN
jgi:hypothetical protein